VQSELREIKPPIFSGEHMKGEEVEAWLLEMKKYFQLHDYPSKVETRIATYHLRGKETMWWDQLKQVLHIKIPHFDNVTLSLSQVSHFCHKCHKCQIFVLHMSHCKRHHGKT
jgi:hypothetical protein